MTLQGYDVSAGAGRRRRRYLIGEHGPELVLRLDVLKALREAIAAQKHYPCQCHDWVWREDHWELVAR